MKEGKIQISYGFICLMCLLYLFDRQHLFWQTVLAAAVHECGHLLVIALTGTRIRSFRLSAYGACIELDEVNQISYATEALIAAGGPTFGACVALTFANVAPVFAGLNLCLSLFNLLPIAPLDGGKILRSCFSSFLDVDLVERCLQWIGLAIGLFLVITVLFFSGKINCTIGMILFSAFLIRMCVL